MTISDSEYQEVAQGLSKKYRRNFSAEEVKKTFWVIRDRKTTTFFRF